MSSSHRTEGPAIPMVLLHPEAVAAVAEAVADRVVAESTRSKSRLLSTRQLADQLGRTPDWVRSHAEVLGVIRLGNGPRPRLLFDPEVALENVNSCSATRGSVDPETPTNKRTSRHRPRKAMGTSTELLPIRGLGDGKSPLRPSPEKDDTNTTNQIIDKEAKEKSNE